MSLIDWLSDVGEKYGFTSSDAPAEPAASCACASSGSSWSTFQSSILASFHCSASM